MSVLVVDEALRAKLADADGPLTVCGPDGKQLGYFTPVGPPAEYNLDPGISEEEIARRMADTTSPTYTTEEVLAKLKSLNDYK